MSKEYDKYVELAENGNLPADFNQWELANKYGWTVAHTAAAYGHLPVGFKQWDLADVHGWTVAHIAARHGYLPEDFNQLGLVDNDGITALHRLLLGGQSDECLSRWAKDEPLYKADADWEVFKKELPEIYQKYTISECMLDVDNDQEAML